MVSLELRPGSFVQGLSNPHMWPASWKIWKCWGAWDNTCGYKAKDITPSIHWRREAWKDEALDDLPWKDERAIVNQTNTGTVSKASLIRQTLEPFQKRDWGNFWETGWNTYGLFWVQRYNLELNWTDLLCSVWGCWQRLSWDWGTWWAMHVVTDALNWSKLNYVIHSTGATEHIIAQAWKTIQPCEARNCQQPH